MRKNNQKGGGKKQLNERPKVNKHILRNLIFLIFFHDLSYFTNSNNNKKKEKRNEFYFTISERDNVIVSIFPFKNSYLFEGIVFGNVST